MTDQVQAIQDERRQPIAEIVQLRLNSVPKLSSLTAERHGIDRDLLSMLW
jgi:hypothetical protein